VSDGTCPPLLGDQPAAWLTDELLGFCTQLRAEGLRITIDQVQAFCGAVAMLGPENAYWTGRAMLLTDRRDVAIYDRVFRRYWRARGWAVAKVESSIPARADDAVVDAPDIGPESPARHVRLGFGASRGEVLGLKSRVELAATELVDLQRDLSRLVIQLPSRLTPRLRGSPNGEVEVRRTVHAAMRIGGEPVRLARATRRRETRKLVLVLDVSRSMARYSERLAVFAHALIRRGVACEVYCFGTHVTRVTTSLMRRDLTEALGIATTVVADWDGGTRIGESLQQLLADSRNVTHVRGSICVIFSDGLDTGEPDLVASAVGRLARLAHRLVWMNPLGAEPGYAPTARSMRAAWPYLDDFIVGADLPAFASLLALAAPGRRSA
jgi:uncharacterized protein